MGDILLTKYSCLIILSLLTSLCLFASDEEKAPPTYIENEMKGISSRLKPSAKDVREMMNAVGAGGLSRAQLDSLARNGKKDMNDST